MQQVTLTLPMIQDIELTASRTARALGEHIGMSPDKIDEVQLAVVEACINAIEHSKSADGEMLVRLLVIGDDDEPTGLEITIRDNGKGFEAKGGAQPAPPTPEPGRLLADLKRGHGLMIIHSLMDEVDIETGADGTQVVMRKLR